MEVFIHELDPNLELVSYEVRDHIVYSVHTSTSWLSVLPSTLRKIHSTYERLLSDLPIFNEDTQLILKVRKWFCSHDSCYHRTFFEHFSFYRPKARRTLRLEEKILETSLTMSSVTAALYLKKTHIPVSKSTIYLMLKKEMINSWFVNLLDFALTKLALLKEKNSHSNIIYKYFYTLMNVVFTKKYFYIFYILIIWKQYYNIF